MRFIFRSLIILFLATLLYAVQRINVMSLGYEIEDLKKEGKQLEQIHKSLVIEKAALTSTERIEKIATSYLGMKQPDDSQIVLVKVRTDSGAGFKSAKTTIGEKDNSPQLKVAKYLDWRR